MQDYSNIRDRIRIQGIFLSFMGLWLIKLTADMYDYFKTNGEMDR